MQLGVGNCAGPVSWPAAVFGKAANAKDADKVLLEKMLVTSVPIKIAIEKLRGFVADPAARFTCTSFVFGGCGNRPSARVVTWLKKLARP